MRCVCFFIWHLILCLTIKFFVLLKLVSIDSRKSFPNMRIYLLLSWSSLNLFAFKLYFLECLLTYAIIEKLQCAHLIYLDFLVEWKVFSFLLGLYYSTNQRCFWWFVVKFKWRIMWEVESFKLLTPWWIKYVQVNHSFWSLH